jgi:CheY-like chemotaxis protein
MNIIPDRLLWFVIDDDLDDQEIFTIAAKKVDPDIECAFANDGVHAVNRFRNDPAFNPGRIFLDVNMPRMNGVECLAQLKKLDSLRNVPIFMCSTSADPKIIANVKNLGAHDFIVKPSTIAEFVTVLAAVHHKV